MRSNPIALLLLLVVFSLSLTARPVYAYTALGDWGHFFMYGTRIYFLNPDGRAFTITLHAFRFPALAWNAKTMPVRVTDPTGEVIISDPVSVAEGDPVLRIPAGAPGTYRLDLNWQGDDKDPADVNTWVESSLSHSVVWTGDATTHAVKGHWVITDAVVPRRFWFWVPRNTKSFAVEAQWIENYMSQREDWGITVFSPRGQRVRALWGNTDNNINDYSQSTFEHPGNRIKSIHVPVEPGCSGRFWCIELRQGDAHDYAKCPVALVGVPPYLSRSPEEWFDPTTGARPLIDPYDDDPFMQSAPTEKMTLQWPWLHHFSPCPALGDPDGNEVRGDATFAIWNPQDQPLKFRVGTYIPRDFDHPKMAHVVMTNAGKTVLDRQDPLEHLHEVGQSDPSPLPDTGAGVTEVHISNVERWIAYTYPATPLVLYGQPVEGGWSRFHLDVGTRQWYFLVPRGVTSFQVRMTAASPNDVLNLEVDAPDRVQQLIYGNSGEVTVQVPIGLDNKIWHLRTEVGSASLLSTPTPADARYLQHRCHHRS